MVKLNVPKSVILPNGRTFVARYKRIKRSELPPNIVREELIHKGQRQEVDVEDLERNKAQGISDFVKKVTRNPLVKRLAKKFFNMLQGFIII